VGLAVRKVTSDRPPYAYNLRFSFMEKQASRKPWEIAVICPLFYDAHNILPFNNTPVIPHEALMLGSQDFPATTVRITFSCTMGELLIVNLLYI